MTPLIHLDNVSIRHDEHVVLEHLSTDVNEGELVYLIGKTGSGKTGRREDGKTGRRVMGEERRVKTGG